MINSLSVIVFTITLFFCCTVNAQRFRRNVTPPYHYPPTSGYQPYNGYSNQYRNAPATYGTYDQAQQVDPGRVIWGPVKPNASTPRDVARIQDSKETDLATESSKEVDPILKGVSRESVASGSKLEPAVAAQQQSQLYRKVTVYDPRTGQRSVRLVRIPTSSLYQQPYRYGQDDRPATARVSKSSNGGTDKLSPPVDAKSIAASSNEIQLDSQVSQATFNDASVTLESPNVATPVPASKGTSMRADGQFSVLDFEDDSSPYPNPVDSLELVAPEN